MAAKATSKKSSKTVARRYAQYCPVARSLDVLGERWTLLIVRNLMMGPQRYTDLRQALPGLATDLLTVRLRMLEEVGYVARRHLPRPAASTVYELTESGQRLALVVLELARVGLARLGTPAEGEDIDPDALVLSLRASFRPEVAGDTEEAYQLELDGEPYVVRAHPGWAETERGTTSEPTLTLATSPLGFAQLVSRAIEPKAALDGGELEIDGPRRALDRFLSMFSYPGSPDALSARS